MHYTLYKPIYTYIFVHIKIDSEQGEWKLPANGNFQTADKGNRTTHTDAQVECLLE